MRSNFLLSPTITYLNHGSFGACPVPVFEDYQQWQLQLEEEPYQFILKHGITHLKRSREALAAFIHCNPEDFFFTANPTTAVNTIMRSLKLEPLDEILSTNLEYGAIDKTWDFYCKNTGVRYVQQEITLPLLSKEHFLEMFWKGYSHKTKVVFISQITSSTALILPVKEIVDRAKELGLITIIDGAHVPGHIALDLKGLDPDYYTGAVHKWLMAPKGSSFLYVNKPFQESLDPLIISWGYDAEVPGESQFLDYHEYNGTRDFTAHLTVPELLKFRKEMDWEKLTNNCKQLILEWYPKYCELLETQPICPVTSEFLGQMCSIPIKTDDAIKLKETLYGRFQIEIPVTRHGDQYWIRLSLQPYNTVEELHLLYDALKCLKEEGILIT